MSEDTSNKRTSKSFDEYDYDVLSMDEKILSYYNTALSQDSLSSAQRKTLETKLSQLTNEKGTDGRVLVKYTDVVYLHKCLKDSQQKGRYSIIIWFYMCVLSVLVYSWCGTVL